MKIQWFGHACFKLTSDKGISVITDPFNEEVGYSLPREHAHIVTVSHGHHDHNYIEAIEGNPTVLQKIGSFYIKDISIKGIRTFHDEVEGKKRGINTVYLINMDGIKICHLGDLGHILSPEKIEEIGGVDVLLIPVGGTYTLGPAEAVTVTQQLKPKLVIPMHFKTPRLSFSLEGVNSFFELIKAGRILKENSIEFMKRDLDGEPKIVALHYEDVYSD